jgi:hypothetical protein
MGLFNQGVGGDEQVGYAARQVRGSVPPCGAGTPESFASLHAFELGSSILNATTGSVQVGWSNVPGFSFPHAGVWFGTAASFTDLTQFLPPGFGGESSATSIIIDQGKIIIGGYADGPSGQHQAVHLDPRHPRTALPRTRRPADARSTMASRSPLNHRATGTHLKPWQT